MTIIYRPLGKSYLDSSEWPALMRKFEGYVGVPYDDGKHIATIGIGVNLRERGYLALVLQKLGVFNANDLYEAARRQANGLPQETIAEKNTRYNTVIDDFMAVINSKPLSRDPNIYKTPGTSPSEIAVQIALNAKLKLPEYLGPSSTQTFSLTQPEAYDVKIAIVQGFTIGPITDNGKQYRLDTLLNNNGISINHDTAEYKILMSLFYNSETKLVGQALLKALGANGGTSNRAEAWFEIRYNSNADKMNAPRRYAESQIFRLYNTTISSDDAKEVYRMFQSHRSDIYAYEIKYGTDPNGSNPTVASKQIANANNWWGLTGDNQVQTLVAILDPAKTAIFNYINGRDDLPGLLKDKLTENNVASTNIYLNPHKSTDTVRTSVLDSLDYETGTYLVNGANDLMIGMDQLDVMFGWKGNDVLIGEGGDDVLVGGEGNDVLYGGGGDDWFFGGQGNDTMYGGADNDVYFIAPGQGVDRIEDKQGNNKIYLCDKEINFFYDMGSNQYKSPDGTVTGDMVGNALVLTDVSGTKVTLNNFQWGDFGTALITLPNLSALPEPDTSNTIVGDLTPVDMDPGQPGVQYGYDQWGNVIVDPAAPSLGRGDVLYDTTVSDKIEGKAGNDSILITRGNGDWVLGGDGNDSISIQASGNNLVEGGAGDDSIYMEATGNNLVEGGAGDDGIYYYRGGDDWIKGGEGNDIIAHQGLNQGQLSNSIIEGGPGSDIILGHYKISNQIFGDSRGDGDTATVMATHIADGEVAPDSGGRGDFLSDYYLYDSGQQSSTGYIYGSNGSDILINNVGKGLIVGGGGNDLIFGDFDGLIWAYPGDQYTWGYTIEVGADNSYTAVITGISITDNTAPSAGDDDLIYAGTGSDFVLAGGGDDEVYGGTGSDKIFGMEGNDFIEGGEGDDTLIGGEGDDYLDGAAGLNMLYGGTGNDIIFSGDDSDFIAGQSGSDAIYGGGGNDILHGDAPDVPLSDQGDDYIDGGIGDDSIRSYGGNDTIYGGAGNDQITSDEGDDYIDAGDGANVIVAGDGNDQIYAGTGDDQIVGGNGFDYIDAGDGNNIAEGQDGGDVIYTGAGNDQIWAGADADIIYGGGGNDQIYADDGNEFDGADFADGEAGDDTIIGAGGNDTLYGGDGNDFVQGDVGASAGNDYLDGGAGEDTLLGQAGDDILYGGTDNDYMQGDKGSDTYIFGRGDCADIIYNADADYSTAVDTIQFGAGINDVTVVKEFNDLRISIIGTADSLLILDWFSGTPYQVDQISFTDGTVLTSAQLEGKIANTIYGTTANDTICGENFADTIYGYAGNDYLYAGAGDDQLIGGVGNDTLVGGTGNDTYLFGRGDGQDTISDYDTAGGNNDSLRFASDIARSEVEITRSGNDMLFRINGTTDQVVVKDWVKGGAYQVERIEFGDGVVLTSDQVTDLSAEIRGTSGDDSLSGSPIRDRLYGDGGNDTLIGNGGNDLVDGGDGNDLLYGGEVISPSTIYGEDYWDYLRNRDGNNTLNGGPGDDTIYGGGGDDIFDGGLGNDSIDGWHGNDHYLFGRDSGQDTIKDDGGTECGIDTLQFASDINRSDVEMSRIGNADVIFRIKGTSDQVVVQDWLWPRGALERIEFGDGTVLTGQEVTDLTAEIHGTLENDTILGTVALDRIYGEEGNDWLYGEMGDDVLDGGDGYDTLFGGDGKDTLYGGLGNDTLHGDLDWDGYYLDGSPDTLFGGEGNDKLYGQKGNDTYDGGPGNDNLGDMEGNDLYLFGRGSGQDVISDNDTYSGNVDILRFASDVARSDVEISRYGNDVSFWIKGTLEGVKVEDWLLGGSNQLERIEFGDGTVLTSQEITNLPVVIRGTSGSDYLPGSDEAEGIYGFEGSDSLIGFGGDDLLDGGDDDDSLSGCDGNDTLIGGLGNDNLSGGTGNDLYLFGRGFGQDRISDYDETVGNVDTLQFASDVACSDVEMTRNGDDIVFRIKGTSDQVTVYDWLMYVPYQLEEIKFGDGVVLSAQEVMDLSADIYGTPGNDSITGSNTLDRIHGEAGDDNLYGNGGDDTIYGGEGNDTLDGGVGADTLIGGLGNDTYIVDSVGDNLTENLNEGTDTVQSSITYTLGANIENLTLTGAIAINGTGNELNNVLTGNNAANLLNGGTGADSMAGGWGNDTYIVDNTGDTVTENASQGTDTVQSSVTYTLGANVENLTLTGTANINGTGNTLNNILTGNSGANTLSGGTGADTMSGGAGDDIYVVDNTGDIVTESSGGGIDTVQSLITYTLGANVENLTLTGTGNINATGNTLNNSLTGNSGANTLTGGTGADTMIGGLGNDTYVVDNAGDVITENLNEGTDTVQSSITYTLGSNLENLTLTGTSAINGTGNELNNTITGNSASNMLTGAAGNDTLNGGTGADTLIGGLGNDTYVVDNTGDVVTEALNEGTDTVQSSITYTLNANVENLTLTGTSTINGTGNSLNNTLTGNSAANVLTGGLGNDTYVIGTGDTVVENLNEGTDTVQSSITYTLGSNLENLTLTGTAAINGTGN